MLSSELTRIRRGIAVAKGPKGLPGSITEDDRLDSRYAISGIQFNGAAVIPPCCASTLPLVLTLTFSSGGRSITLDSPLIVYGEGEIDIGDGSRIPLSMITEFSTLAGPVVTVYATTPLALIIYKGQLLTNAVFAPVDFNNINLTGISDVSRGNLTSLDLTGVKALDQTFNFMNNKIASLVFDSQTATAGWLFNNNSLTTLDLSEKTTATTVHLNNNPFVSLVLPAGNNNLVDLAVSYCGLTSVTPSDYPSLQRLECAGNTLSALDLASNTQLAYLDCSGNGLTALDVAGLTALIEIYCDYNQLDQDAANALVAQLVSNGATDGVLTLTGNTGVTNPGTGDWATLVTNGWAISPAP
jgi:hypothetical protein